MLANRVQHVLVRRVVARIERHHDGRVVGPCGIELELDVLAEEPVDWTDQGPPADFVAHQGHDLPVKSIQKRLGCAGHTLQVNRPVSRHRSEALFVGQLHIWGKNYFYQNFHLEGYCTVASSRVGQATPPEALSMHNATCSIKFTASDCFTALHNNCSRTID